MSSEVDGGKIKHYWHELIEVAEEITPDSEVQGLVDSAIRPYRASLETVIGETATALHRYAKMETTMDNLLLQSLIDATGAELAFLNGWRYGAPIPMGSVTMNDLWNIIPINPPVSTIEINGQEL